MVAGQQQPMDGGSGGVFDRLDPKLTIYALANGMDLVKDAGTRSLEWYRDGLERGILIEAEADGGLSVTSRAWKTHEPGTAHSSPQRQGMAVEALVQELSDILQEALEAANALA